MVGLDEKWVFIIAASSLLLSVAGCGPLDDDWEWGQSDPCDQAYGNVDVAGSWRLSGTGKWSDCDNGVADDEVFELSSVRLTVAQHGSASRQSDTLSLNPAPPNVDFVGDVRGTCVSFQTAEQTDESTLEFEFDGNHTSEGHIEGEFTGSGPGSCESSGEFTVRIQ